MLFSNFQSYRNNRRVWKKKKKKTLTRQIAEQSRNFSLNAKLSKSNYHCAMHALDSTRSIITMKIVMGNHILVKKYPKKSFYIVPKTFIVLRINGTQFNKVDTCLRKSKRVYHPCLIYSFSNWYVYCRILNYIVYSQNL